MPNPASFFGSLLALMLLLQAAAQNVTLICNCPITASPVCANGTRYLNACVARCQNQVIFR